MFLLYFLVFLVFHLFYSCLAVNDLLRGRNLDEVVDALPVLWENLFRVRDDIKESVRNAAEMALKTLSRVSWFIRLSIPCRLKLTSCMF